MAAAARVASRAPRRAREASTRARRGTPSRTSTRASRPRSRKPSPVIPDPSSTRPASPSPRAGSQLESNAKAMNIQCKVCMATFLCTMTEAKLKEHSDNKHPKNDFYQCFPHLKA